MIHYYQNIYILQFKIISVTDIQTNVNTILKIMQATFISFQFFIYIVYYFLEYIKFILFFVKFCHLQDSKHESITTNKKYKNKWQRYFNFLLNSKTNKLRAQQLYKELIAMGIGCTGASPNRKSKAIANIVEVDKELLKLIYEDLALRVSEHYIIKENFATFFHLNGLWSQRLFDKFDKVSRQYITFEDFEEGFNLMMKSSFSKRIQCLFDIYDTDGNGGISFYQFVKMMYSYPIEQLQQILEDQKFKKTLDKTQQLYFFKDSNILNLKQKYFLETEQQECFATLTMQKAKTQYQQNPDQLKYQTETKVQEQKCEVIRKNIIFAKEENEETMDSSPEKRSQKLQSQCFKIENEQLEDITVQNQPIDYEHQLYRKQSEISISSERPKFRVMTKNCKIVSRITVLVKKYASFLFDQNNLDKNRDQLSKEQFEAIAMHHPQLLLPFHDGFHSYAWQLTEQGVPKFRYEKIEFQSQCDFEYKGTRILGEVQLIKSTIFFFKKKSDRLPIQIKCLQGLAVQQIKHQSDSQNQFGIIFKHKDGHYPEKPCYFKTPEILEKWLKMLEDYTFNTIHDEYQFDQIIGSGNFGKVYKAFSKQKIQEEQSENQQTTLPSQSKRKEVAIKAIEKMRLNDHQYQLVKLQCSILELLHHRNIVKFIKIYETRNYFYIVTQYFSKGDLFEFISMKEFLDQYQAAIVIKQLLEVAAYLNQLGLIHRDFKPENVMVITDEANNLKKVKLIDFGLAVYKDYLNSLEPAKRIAGTPGFIAPEAFQEQIMDEKSDLFSIGVILYEMLCGKLPFQSKDVYKIIAQSRQCKINFQDKSSFCWSKISQQAKDLIKKLIAPHQKRISIKQALAHQWLQDMQKLKKRLINKRKYYKQLEIFE